MKLAVDRICSLAQQISVGDPGKDHTRLLFMEYEQRVIVYQHLKREFWRQCMLLSMVCEPHLTEIGNYLGACGRNLDDRYAQAQDLGQISVLAPISQAKKRIDAYKMEYSQVSKVLERSVQHNGHAAEQGSDI